MSIFAGASSSSRLREERARPNEVHAETFPAAQSARLKAAPAPSATSARCQSALAHGDATSQLPHSCFRLEAGARSRARHRRLHWRAQASEPVFFRKSGLSVCVVTK